MNTVPADAANLAAAATPEIVIDVHGLTKSFGGRQVVRDLSMQVKRGTIFGFLGPNGSGNHHHPHAVRTIDAGPGQRHVSRLRHPHRRGQDQNPRRLHDATLQPLR
jgi:ABC-type glutathione transport system ATPase component